VPRKKDPPPDVVDPLAPIRRNPSKVIAKALSGADLSQKAATQATKKATKKKKKKKKKKN
jgi:hypothetical protein